MKYLRLMKFMWFSDLCLMNVCSFAWNCNFTRLLDIQNINNIHCKHNALNILNINNMATILKTWNMHVQQNIYYNFVLTEIKSSVT